MNKYTYTTIVALVALFMVPFAVQGAVFHTGEEYTLPEKEIVRDDLYVGAGASTISGNVTGDLLIGGGEVTVLGQTSGSLIAGGGNIIVSGGVGGDALVLGGDINMLGFVRDDLRVAGGNVSISNAVGGDVVVFGGVTNIVSGSAVSGDVVIFGGLATIDGTVNGDVTMKGGELRINGTVQGKIDAKVDGGLTLGDKAVIGGGMYKSPKEATIAEGATVRGDLSFEKVASKGKDLGPIGGAIFAAWAVTAFLMMIVFGFIAIYFVPNGVSALLSHTSVAFWKNVLIGFISLIILPVLAVILLMTVIGIPLAGLVLLSYLGAMLLGYLFVPLMAGGLAVKYLSRSETLSYDWKAVVLGAILVLLVASIPVVGGLIVCIFFIASFGGVLSYFHKKLWAGH